MVHNVLDVNLDYLAELELESGDGALVGETNWYEEVTKWY